MNNRDIIRNYFKSWIAKDPCIIDNYFDEYINYTECYGPVYIGKKQCLKWFEDWNRVGSVLSWDIKNIYQDGENYTVEWCFKCDYEGSVDEFDGVSIIKIIGGKIVNIKEFQSKNKHYYPYLEEEEKSVICVLVPTANKILSIVKKYKKSVELPLEGIPPHITLQFPWIPPTKITEKDLKDLEKMFTSFKPFKFKLEIGWFGEEVLILKPVISDKFIKITEKIVSTWPEYPYYSGEYSKIEPHLTIANGENSILRTIANDIKEHLPLECLCSRVDLSVGVPGNMKILRELKIGD